MVGGARIMVYRCEHYSCEKIECKPLTAYVRINGNWTRIGHYGSGCKKFESLDLQKEEQDRLDAERRIQLDAEIRRVKQENRTRLKIIENVNNSFFHMN